MKNALIFLLLCLIINSCKKAQIEATRSSEKEIPWADSSIRHPKHLLFSSLIKKYNQLGLPGISLLVNDANGTWVGSTGKADISRNIDFGPGQVSKAASITKLLVGALVFKLIEDSSNSGLGYRSLSLPINTWLPKRITDRLPNGNKITLGHVMKHESGIPDLVDNNDFYLAVVNHPNKKWPPEELISFFYDKEPLFKPGDTAIYSNTNTVLIAMVIEYVTGKKHSDLLKEKIIKPLNMDHTYYQPHDELPSSTAQGYFDLYNNSTLVNVSNIVTGSGNGYGGIYSNVFDLQKFTNALLIQKTLLSSKSLAVMETYGKTDGINRYGYGIMKKFIDLGGNFGIGHPGRDLGYSANLFYFPGKKVTHIFFTNYGTDADSNLKKEFLKFQDELIQLSLQ